MAAVVLEVVPQDAAALDLAVEVCSVDQEVLVMAAEVADTADTVHAPEDWAWLQGCRLVHLVVWKEVVAWEVDLAVALEDSAEAPVQQVDQALVVVRYLAVVEAVV